MTDPHLDNTAPPSVAHLPAPLSEETATAMFGPQCPDCGWRRGRHRPAGAWTAPCPTTRQDDR